MVSNNPVGITSFLPCGARLGVNGCAFALSCFAPAIFSANSFADDVQVAPFEIRQEETQLAQRLALRESVESPFEYALSTGYRRDDLSWSIADGGVNVASEVSFKRTEIVLMRAEAKVHLWHEWLLRGSYATGAVRSGGNQDSDYAGSNRTREFSRSDNKTGGAVSDLGVGVGRRVHLFDVASWGALYVTPLVGYSLHQQNMTMFGGVQTIPATGALNGLGNSYDTRWSGPWVGLDALFAAGRDFSLGATVEYHQVDYSAAANWNLRGDFSHPVSFNHVAQGRGVVALFSTSYRLSRCFLLNASFERQNWNTYAGYDQTHFAYGATNYYTLNPVSWDSTSFLFGAVYRF